jgi:hypothetical protein
MIILIFCLFVYFRSSNSHIPNGLEPEFDPTIEELSRGLVIRPYDSWGYNIRKEKNVRLLALGTEMGFII